ncbi:MAG: tetratricopeptide repeat protein [Candidatus Neomarinimicrobiota bacterium]
MLRKKYQFVITMSIGFLTLSAGTAITDTPFATFTPAQSAWLLDERAKALTNYQTEFERTATTKEISAYNIAFLYFLDEKYGLSQKWAEKALVIKPQFSTALVLRGRLALQSGDYETAIRFFQIAGKCHPKSHLPDYYTGLCYYELKKYDQARKYLESAIDDKSDFSAPYAVLADIYIKTHQYTKARNLLEKGLAVSYDAEILLTLARLFDLSESKTDAQKFFGLFVYFFPNHPAASEARQWLKDHDISEIFSYNFKPLPPRSAREFAFKVGEDNLYNVSWGPLKVGELNTGILEELTFNGRPAYEIKFCLDSNPALEFIASLHSDYITIIDRDTKQAIQHFLHIRENSIISDKVYDFDRRNGKFICHIVNGDGSIDYLEKYLPFNAIDGTSILFYSRQVVYDKQFERVMTIIDENFVISDIVFENKTEPVAVRGQQEQAWLISGDNYYKGIVGFTGKFRGWFRIDEHLLPLQADFEIWVGRISVSMATIEEQRLHKYMR